MQRWHHERHIARRNYRDLARLLNSDFDQPLDRSRPLGRFRKRSGLDCGRAKCFLCHGDKLLDRRTRDECSADLKMKEGIDELYGR